MDDKMKQLTVKLLKDWMASTNPDEPFLARGSKAVTPREYVAEVENETPEGKEFLKFMEDSAQRYKTPLEKFLKDSIRPNPPKP